MNLAYKTPLRRLDKIENPTRSFSLIFAYFFCALVFLARLPFYSGNYQEVSIFDKWACINYPKNCLDVARISKSETKKIEYLSISCKNDIRLFCNHIAFDAININLDKSIEYMDSKCNKNNAWACYFLATIHIGTFKTSKDINIELSFKYSLRACNLGDARGCLLVGKMHYNGTYVDKNVASASFFYKKSCDLPRKDGCAELAKFYFSLIGFPMDLKKIYELSKFSCDDQQNAIGCNILASMYEIGLYKTKYLDKALYYYQKACRIGYGNQYDCYKNKITDLEIVLGYYLFAIIPE